MIECGLLSTQENGPTKGSFVDRSCALVTRALTGQHNGHVVQMHTPTDAQSMQLKIEQLQPPSSGGEAAVSRGEGMQATTIAISTLLLCPTARKDVLATTSSARTTSAQPGSDDADLCVSKEWSRANLADGLPSFVNFVSLDVEGLEFEILKFWPFDDVRVGAW